MRCCAKSLQTNLIIKLSTAFKWLSVLSMRVHVLCRGRWLAKYSIIIKLHVWFVEFLNNLHKHRKVTQRQRLSLFINTLQESSFLQAIFGGLGNCWKRSAYCVRDIHCRSTKRPGDHGTSWTASHVLRTHGIWIHIFTLAEWCIY